jgi:hypothetical protein
MFVYTIISGAMKLESTTFRPREVVKHVLQTAAASLKKELTLVGCIGDDVPVEVKRITYPLCLSMLLRFSDFMYLQFYKLRSNCL